MQTVTKNKRVYKHSIEWHIWNAFNYIGRYKMHIISKYFRPQPHVHMCMYLCIHIPVFTSTDGTSSQLQWNPLDNGWKCALFSWEFASHAQIVLQHPFIIHLSNSIVQTMPVIMTSDWHLGHASFFEQVSIDFAKQKALNRTCIANIKWWYIILSLYKMSHMYK